ncbi:hypothetical protein [Coxiella burnetii]|uniref:hypothetical protein n=1 Tax=Coxiella burnetii TaxID=777 RepID=UPI00223133CE|nr:hypothetical protein [Coxiella burnetii]
MTRDYAKQSRPRRKRRWLTFIVVSGGLALFFSLILYLKTYLLHPHHKVITPPPLPHPAAVSTTAQPQFDFYTLLPKMQVTSSKVNDSDSEPQNSHSRKREASEE